MRYLKLFEDNSGSKLELIKNIIKENQFLSKYADQITEDSLKEFNEYIYVKLPDELNSPHINKHFDKSNPGSIWSISKEEVTKLILETLAKKPTKSLQEGPTFKYKWLNLEYTKPVGFDSLKKVDGDISKEVDLEPFGMVERVKEWEKVDAVAKQNGYELVAKEDDNTREYTEEDLKNNVPCFIKQEVGVVEGDKMQNPTKTYNLITAKVGEVEGKPVLTLMTVFPGVNPVDKDGKDITNKKDLSAAGYALIKSKKTNESINKLKYLKTFESFKVFESNDEEFTVTNETTVDELDTYLSEYVDGLHDYGAGYMIVDKVNFIVYNSLMAKGKSESEAEKIADDFTKRMMDEDSSTTHNEYGEGTTSGSVKYNSRDIFEFDCHDDGYGFSGNFNDLSALLTGIKELLEE
jgi:hypothetical protein